MHSPLPPSSLKLGTLRRGWDLDWNYQLDRSRNRVNADRKLYGSELDDGWA